MRGGAFAGVVIATVCGVFTAYTTFQPALQEQKEKRQGTFGEQHQKQEGQDNALSKAIAEDLMEAKREVAKYDKGRFAWGIRNALFGKPTPADESQSGQPSNASQQEEKDSGK